MKNSIYQGKVVFTARLSSDSPKILFKEDIAFKPKIKGIDSACIRQSESSELIILDIMVKAEKSYNELCEVAQNTANTIARAIILEPEIQIQEIKFTLCSQLSEIEKVTGDGSQKISVFNSTLYSVSEMTISHNITRKTANKLIQKIERNIDLYSLKLEDSITKFYVEQFIFSCSQRDLVSKFMTLYQIILFEGEDNQGKTDEIIVGITLYLKAKGEVMPDIKDIYQSREIIINDSSKPKAESIYTKLRNQIGHCRRYPKENNNCIPVSIDKTIHEISKYINYLINIVRELILIKYADSKGYDKPSLEDIKKQGEEEIAEIKQPSK